jgi:hypothetical protein
MPTDIIILGDFSYHPVLEIKSNKLIIITYCSASLSEGDANTKMFWI